ncbi:peptide/nickel transport system ATP-binding protein [Tistlia consotensis]|uniref:Peptide/nickel transport system ATP-binding protein n=1 Tax=Tistlia consotensis USBA 355 TaxID=560819 RepID=A0A1Y6BDR4_9PROT|nr:ABC transporter ATP-binding protein [Tistlia consotensis]SMF04794.1 peptide/nickel transport system ATP-binding protein [Tistlia consotensis USBA 355]SNR54804.1 peptide/nickel transport system ATP-binding protein [Tistlia consotensis]
MRDKSKRFGAPVLECRNLCLSYFTRAGEIPAVIDFSMTLHEGEAIGLVGESGCGKSTVALAIMRYLGGNGKVVGGEILYNGRDMLSFSEEELRQLRGNEIAMVYQEPMASLNPSMLIGRQLMEVPLFHEKGVTEAQAAERVLDMLGAVKLPDPERVFRSYPHQISGGQQQRVVIAMALLSKPKLLLLDEPTTALDVTVEAGIIELIAEIAERFNTSMIYISHNLGLILETCDRINVMYSGQVVETGAVEEVFNEMRHPYTQGLFDCIPLPGADKTARPLVPIRGQLPLPHERPKGCYFGPRCDHFVAGRCDAGMIPMSDIPEEPGHAARCIRWNEIDWDAHRPHGLSTEGSQVGPEVLHVDRMRKYYELSDTSLAALIKGKTVRYVKANEQITFTARESQTVAIVGESGCGKSTFAKVLMGLETATDGTVQFRGGDLGKKPVQARSPKEIGSLQMIFQNPFDTLNPSHSVGSQLARVIRKFGVETDRRKVEQRVLELLDLVKLPREFARRRPRQLSGGQKQRVGIARAFAGNPSMVVADEPVSALDVSVAAAVTGLLMDIQRSYRTTLLFISHDLSLVRYLADRVVVMYLGHIVEQGTTDEVFSPPYHPYTEALLSAVPIADTSVHKKRIILEGALPSVLNPPKGCPFNTRCHRKIGRVCETEAPPNRVDAPGHEILCHIELEELRAVEPVIVQVPKGEAAE